MHILDATFLCDWILCEENRVPTTDTEFFKIRLFTEVKNYPQDNSLKMMSAEDGIQGRELN